VQGGHLGFAGRVLPHPDVGHVAVAVDCDFQQDHAAAAAAFLYLLGRDAEPDVVLRSFPLRAYPLTSSAVLTQAEVIERDLDLGPSVLFADDRDRFGDRRFVATGAVSFGASRISTSVAANLTAIVSRVGGTTTGAGRDM